MNVLLINPAIPRHNMILDFADRSGSAPVFREKDGPPLGLNDLAAILYDEEVRILDLRALYDKNLTIDVEKTLVQELKSFEPDIVGVTCMAAQVRGALRGLRLAKEYNPKILTLIGGLHPTSCPQDVCDPYVDLIVLGLGKRTLRSIVDEFKRAGHSADFSHINGIAKPVNGNLQFTQSLGTLSRQDIIKNYYCDKPFPNRSLTDTYNYHIGHNNMQLHYLNTSIGCPHRCNFCSLWTFYNGHYICRNIESIIEELKTMDRYQIIRFCDANTFGNVRFAKQLFQRIEEEGLKHGFVVDGRTDSVTRHLDVWKAAAQAGLKVVIMGLDATTDSELAEYNKGVTINTTEDAIVILHGLGVWVSGNYIVRCDYNEHQFDHMAHFIETHPIFFSGFTILTPFPGTEQYEKLQEQIVIKDLDYYNLTYPVLKTRLPEDIFHKRLNELYQIGIQSANAFQKAFGNRRKEASGVQQDE